MSDELKKHLAAKERSVEDLTQFLSTRTDKVPNYTLLLGAGASVTSGVRSAGELIEVWRRELYERLCLHTTAPYNTEHARTYLAREHAQWYSTQREYSSLFEKKFDLPRQRRMFVENEVDGKMPSLGYAYLIRLIETHYLNTVFTTNFDDLLNESFHQFSDIRPIVCAHDSSISSVTVTSKRPKLIKLHGDYLFDDIKSTVRETESLEENTKKKFIEFAKDHGLIVIGYGGHDRSIMDVLQYLLKQEEYFKHGIYWCLRASEKPSEELTKLLWRERAYWVPIDGFDELMAQLHDKCIGSALPIDTALVSEKPREVIGRFCDDGMLKNSPSAVIQRDLGKLRQEMNREALVESLRDVTRMDREDGREASGLRDSDVIKLMSIRQLMDDHDFSRALAKIHSDLAHTSSEDFRAELLLRRLNIEEAMGEPASALKTCEMLLSQDPFNAFYLLIRSRNEQSFEAKLNSLSRAITMDPYYSSAYNLRAQLHSEQLDGDPNCNVPQVCAKIRADYEQSIIVHPSISNPAFREYVRFLLDSPLSKHEIQTAVDALLQGVEELDPFSKTYLGMLVDYAGDVNNGKPDKTDVIVKLRQAIEVQPKARKIGLQLLLLRALKLFDKTSELLAEISTYDSDERWSRNRDFVELRARVYAEKEGKIHDAVRRIQAYKLYRKSPGLVRLLVKYFGYLNKFGDAQSLLDQCGSAVDRELRDSLQAEIDSGLGKHERVLVGIRRRQAESTFPANLAVNEVHALLKLARNSEAEAVAREVLEVAHFSQQFDALIINLELSVLRQGRKIDKVRLSKVLERSGSDSSIKLCALLLLDDRVRAADMLIDAVRIDRTESYTFCQWALFDNPANRTWLTSTLKSRGLSTDFDGPEMKAMAS